MAIVSDIEIRLAADIAHLRQNMNEARSTVDRAMGGISSAAKLAGGALAGLAAGMSIAAFAGWIKSAIDATDVVSDLSQRTGVAIEQIAGLQLWFQKGGMEAGAFESSMVKLSKNIAEGGEAFDRLGIKTKGANGQLRSNVDVLLETADKFKGLEDGTQKTALALELFGKSGAELLPMLNEGSEGLRAMNEMAEKLGITFDEKTVNAAGDFNDTLDFLGLAGQGVARQVAAQLLPTLNSLAGTFLETATKGNMVKRAADMIGFALKSLYTIGVGIVSVFTTVGDTLGASAAIIVSVLQGDFATAREISMQWQKDVKDTWSNAAKTISDAWSGAGGETVAAMAAMTKNSTKVADKVSADAKRQEDSYKSLIGAIREKVRESAAEAAGMQPLNDAQKMLIKLDEDMAAGKVKLSAAQEAAVRSTIAQYAANLDLLESQKDFKKMADELAKADADRQAETKKVIDAARQEAEAQENLVLTFGMTKSAIMALEVARLEEQLAQKDSNNLTYEEIDTLKQLIFLKKRAAEASASNDILEAEKDATKKATDEQIKMVESIEKTWHDTFVSITDGGANAAERLWKSFKNGFFDLLYQMTLKPFVVNVATSMTGASGLAQAAGAGGAGAGGGLMSMIGNATGLASAFSSFGGTLATGFMNTIAGTGFGASLTAGSAMLSGGFTASGLGMMAGAIAPYAIAAIAGSALLKKAFGRGPKETTGQGITGTFGMDGFTGGQSYTEWIKKGGWFRSDKKGTDTKALDDAMAQQLDAAYKAIKDSTGAFAAALGVPADTVTSYTKQLKLALTGDQAKDQALVTQLFADMGDELATRVLPNVAEFIKQGETASTTLQRLAAEFQTVDAVLSALGITSQQAFGAVGTASLAARDRLIELSGGLESFTAQADYFSQNFLTEAERLAPTQKAVTEQLAKLGYSSLSTVEQFKAAVMGLATSGALSTQAGADAYAGLMALAPAFKAVADAAQESAQKLADALRTAAEGAFSVLQRSVEAQKKSLGTDLARVLAGIDTAIDGMAAKVTDLSSLASALSSASGAVLGDSQAGMARMQAQAQLAAAAAIAKASGVLPSADSLKGALEAVSRQSEGMFASYIDEQRDTLLTANSIEELSGMTGQQLSTAEQALQVLKDQRTATQSAYDQEIARLDGLLAAAQAQLDGINGVNNSVMSVAAALASFQGAIGATAQSGIISSTPGAQGSQLESLYQSVLGRGADASGLAFWQQQMANGVGLDAIRDQFMTSQEYLSRVPVYSTQQSGTMGVNELAAGLDTMNAKLEAIAANTGRSTTILDMATNGGNAMAVVDA